MTNSRHLTLCLANLPLHGVLCTRLQPLPCLKKLITQLHFPSLSTRFVVTRRLAQFGHCGIPSLARSSHDFLLESLALGFQLRILRQIFCLCLCLDTDAAPYSIVLFRHLRHQLHRDGTPVFDGFGHCPNHPFDHLLLIFSPEPSARRRRRRRGAQRSIAALRAAPTRQRQTSFGLSVRPWRQSSTSQSTWAHNLQSARSRGPARTPSSGDTRRGPYLSRRLSPTSAMQGRPDPLKTLIRDSC